MPNLKQDDGEYGVSDIDGAAKPNGGLFDGFEAYKTPTEADYARLLAEGIVVPDANVFLNLYRYNEQTRNDLLAVFRQLGDRLWVPHQVIVEFWRNRETVLQDPRATTATLRDLEGQRNKAVNTLRLWAPAWFPVEPRLKSAWPLRFVVGVCGTFRKVKVRLS